MHIFFSDLDGTLLNSQGVVTPVTLKAIQNFIVSGNKFVISSGRSLSSIYGVIERAGLPSENLLIISYNGSYVFDTSSQRALVEYRIPLPDVKKILDTAEKMGIHGHTYTDTAVAARRPDPEIQYYTNSVKIPAVFDENILNLLEKEPLKLLAISLDHKEKLLALQKKLLPMMQHKYTSFFSADQLLEFVDIRSGKGNAVRTVCNLLGLQTKDAYAAGDAGNDISMLEAVGHSIAMCNGTEEVKAISSQITKLDNNHDGLADIISSLI